jgi:hypothetical protein
MFEILHMHAHTQTHTHTQLSKFWWKIIQIVGVDHGPCPAKELNKFLPWTQRTFKDKNVNTEGKQQDFQDVFLKWVSF